MYKAKRQIDEIENVCLVKLMFRGHSRRCDPWRKPTKVIVPSPPPTSEEVGGEGTLNATERVETYMSKLNVINEKCELI